MVTGLVAKLVHEVKSPDSNIKLDSTTTVLIFPEMNIQLLKNISVKIINDDYKIIYGKCSRI